MSSLSSPPFVIDAHVHLWEDGARRDLAWLEPGHRLDRACTLADYVAAVQTPAAAAGSSGDDGRPPLRVGYVYIETDRKNDGGADWTLALEEVAYARGLVEAEADGDATCMAIVPWAPVHSGPEVLARYLDAVREAAGPVAWPRVRGFRYLAQDKPHGTLLADAFVDAVRLLGRRGFAFDLGIDARRRGRAQLAEAVSFVERVHTVPGSLGGSDNNDGPPSLSVTGTPLPDSEKTVIVLNHLAKPDLTVLNPQADRGFAAWRDALFALGRASPDHVFVKVSGLFSEMPPALRDQSPQAFFGAVYPWLAVLLAAFGPSRLMFASDWPICTLGFPDDDDEPAKDAAEEDAAKEDETKGADVAKPLNPGEASAWNKWRQIVAYLCYMASLDEDAAAMVWGGTAVKAYGLEKK